MLAWISSIIVNIVGGSQSEKVFCINSRGIHLVEPLCGCERVLHLRNKLLGNHKIKYFRRKIFGSKRHMVRQILRTTGDGGEFTLSTLR